MPSEGRRLHGFTVVSGSIGLARQLILPAILGGASAGDSVSSTLQWVVIILSVPSILLAFARWLMFRYRLEADDLVIDSGVLSRQRRVIPLGRIQNIDLQQSPLERLAGVAGLRLETASGGGDTEAALSVLSLDEARALQADLMRRRSEIRAAGRATADPATFAAAVDGGEAAARAEEEPARRLLRLSLGQLAVAGATSNEAGLFAAGLATGIELVGGTGILDPLGARMEEVFEGGAGGVMAVVVAGAVLVLLFIVVGWVLSVVVTTVRYYGFTLTRQGDDIRREFGLLSRHHSTVPLERVQAVRIEESLLRRPFGLVTLKVETAGGAQQGQRSGESEAFVPIARKRDVGRLLREVFPDARFEGVELNPVSPVSRRRSFLRLALPVVAAAVLAALLVDLDWLWLLALLLPAWLYAGAEFRARGWARPGGFALVRGGVLTRVNWVVPEEKIQTLHMHETPFQRRLRLASLLVDTAAGGRVARVIDLDRGSAGLLLQDLARDAERARRHAHHHALRPHPPAAR